MYQRDTDPFRYTISIGNFSKTEDICEEMNSILSVISFYYTLTRLNKDLRKPRLKVGTSMKLECVTSAGYKAPRTRRCRALLCL